MTLDEIRHRLKASDKITYHKMARSSASIMVEFENMYMHMVAIEKMDAAFPNSTRLTGSEYGKYRIVLNTDEEVTYFDLIVSSLK